MVSESGLWWAGGLSLTLQVGAVVWIWEGVNESAVPRAGAWAWYLGALGAVVALGAVPLQGPLRDPWVVVDPWVVDPGVDP